jgi:hypothetical protein
MTYSLFGDRTAGTAWHNIAKTLRHYRGIIGDNLRPDLREETRYLDDAECVTSQVWGSDGKHKVVLDIDMPAALIPSTTEGHFHLYIDRELKWKDYRLLLEALARAGVISQGYADHSIQRKFTTVRLPWVKKSAHEEDS